MECECYFFFFKQKTAYEIYQCDWSSDVCSSDLEAILKSAIQMYYASNGAYPQTLDGLIPGGYVSSVPRVDGYGIDYDAATGVVKYRRGYD